MKHKLLTFICLLAILFTSCAHDKTFNVKGHEVTAKTYGWANTSDKMDGVVYNVSIGNVVWSVILCETVVAPIWLTGWDLYYPVKIGEEGPDNTIKNLEKQSVKDSIPNK